MTTTTPAAPRPLADLTGEPEPTATNNIAPAADEIDRGGTVRRADQHNAAYNDRLMDELPRLAAHEQSRYGAAAESALRRYPGPVGELIHRELIAYARFGRCFNRDALIPHLMTHMLAAPSPSSEKDVDATSTYAATAGAPADGEGTNDDPRASPSASGRSTSAPRSFLTAPGPDLWPRPNSPARPPTQPINAAHDHRPSDEELADVALRHERGVLTRTRSPASA